MIDETHPVFYDATGGFANADKSVISWEGSNYYRACEFPVVVSPDGSISGCVKRVEHPGDIHEDYDGNRKAEQHGRLAIVVTREMGEDLVAEHAKTQEVMQALKLHFQEAKGIKIYGAVREQADQIIMILEGDG